MTFSKHILRSVTVEPSARLAQVLGMFDVTPSSTSVQAWDVSLNLPDHWHVGVIVGPSGSGKSTIARELFGQDLAADFPWPAGRSILDGFPAALTIRQITGLLGSVGFSSPPAWVRPFACLSNGQQFRVNLARTLADAIVDGRMKVVDEYSSVVDRTVARIGSAAVAKTVRQQKLQFVAVTCHYDVIDWLQPDWIYEPGGKLEIGPGTDATPDREGLRPPDREGLRPPGHEGLRRPGRPAIAMEIIRTTPAAWHRFEPHHYLSGTLHKASACYAAIVEDQPAAFTAVLPFPHPTHSGYREHRTVCLPDFQGVGIGNAMSEFVASIYTATGKPYTSTTSHPAMIGHRARSPLWRMTRKPSLGGTNGKRFSLMRKTAAVDRLTAGFAYVGPTRPDDARAFGLI